MAENDPIREALSRAMAICATNEHCSDDILNKLRSLGLNDKDAGEVLNRLEKDNFVSDKRYSRAFVNDKFRQNKWGKIKIAAMLRAKRISSEMISSALESIDEEQYMLTLRDIIARQRKVTKARTPYELKGKLVRFAMTRGFESDLIYEILNEI
jgi:regulatory protein